MLQIGFYEDDTAIFKKISRNPLRAGLRKAWLRSSQFSADLLLSAQTFNGLETIATRARWDREARLILNECIQHCRRGEQRAED